MRFIPREEKFFDLFEELADKIEEGSKLFLDMIDHYDSFERDCQNSRKSNTRQTTSPIAPTRRCIPPF